MQSLDGFCKENLLVRYRHIELDRGSHGIDVSITPTVMAYQPGVQYIGDNPIRSITRIILHKKNVRRQDSALRR